MSRLWNLFLRFKARRLFGRPATVFGDFTVIHPENIRMGRNCSINHGVFIHGKAGITIGDDVVLSARCMIIDATLDIETFTQVEPRIYANKPIAIGDGAWIGAAALVLPGVTIGERSIVGAGSVVTRDVPPYTIVAGNPARPIGKVDPFKGK